MDTELDRRRPDTFVIHVVPGGPGDLAGLVHHLRTGQKRRFEGLPELGAAIRAMTHGGESETGPNGG